MTANLTAKAGWGPRTGVMRPGIRSEKLHEPGQDRSFDRRDARAPFAAATGQRLALITAGDLVFWGDLNRRFRAFDADTGKVLWESVVGGMVMTSTITYSVNGKQYVLINTGEGQSVTAGPLNLTKAAMPKAIRGHNSVVAFALP